MRFYDGRNGQLSSIRGSLCFVTQCGLIAALGITRESRESGRRAREGVDDETTKEKGKAQGCSHSTCRESIRSMKGTQNRRREVKGSLRNLTPRSVSADELSRPALAPPHPRRGAPCVVTPARNIGTTDFPSPTPARLHCPKPPSSWSNIAGWVIEL